MRFKPCSIFWISLLAAASAACFVLPGAHQSLASYDDDDPPPPATPIPASTSPPLTPTPPPPPTPCPSPAPDTFTAEIKATGNINIGWRVSLSYNDNENPSLITHVHGECHVLSADAHWHYMEKSGDLAYKVEWNNKGPHTIEVEYADNLKPYDREETASAVLIAITEGQPPEIKFDSVNSKLNVSEIVGGEIDLEESLWNEQQSYEDVYSYDFSIVDDSGQ